MYKKNNILNIYVCGITPYSDCHIGHLRTFLIFDIIIKYYIYLGYKIKYVRNITDIDDNIINKCNKYKIKYKKLTNIYINKYNKIFNNFNLIKPNFEPKVSDYIKNIIDSIKILINKKYAYINENKDILFKLDKINNYGEISNRINNINKKDFVIWKYKNNNKYEPIWETPWGKGRPGWHIECSVISNIFFNIIDIHGGGIDLIFPHHENEFLQSKILYKNFYIKKWIHIGNVNFLNKKMSKSSHNSIYIKNLTNNYDLDTIKYYLTKKKYKKPINFNFNDLKKSKNSILKLYKTMLLFYKYKKKYQKSEFTKEFIKILDKNYNTPKAYSLIFKMNNSINKLNYNKYKICIELTNEMKNLAYILGILQYNPVIYIKNNYFNKKYPEWDLNSYSY